MRKRFAIPLIAVVGAVPWFWFHPGIPPAEQPARFVSSLDFPGEADWVGGISGIDLTPDGKSFFLVTDRGHMARGRLVRASGILTEVVIESVREFTDKAGKVREFPHTDAEGIALDSDGQLFVSFEHAQRVLQYDQFESQEAKWPSYTTAWRALESNGGLEAVAVDSDGTIYTLPEAIASGATEALVYRKKRFAGWEQPFTLPVESAFKPVGADFGPDGLFYLLERAVYPFGFYSRVRRMSLTETGPSDLETVLVTPLHRHGNLEGLSVWQDQNGAIRLTMVSDDNFIPFFRGEIVEYRITDGVAQTDQGQ